MPNKKTNKQGQIVENNYYNENEHPDRSGWATFHYVGGAIMLVIFAVFLLGLLGLIDTDLTKIENQYAATIFGAVAINGFFIAFLINLATDSRQYLQDTVNFQQLQLDIQQEQLQLLQDLKEDYKANKD